MEITETKTEKAIVLKVEGRIDTNTSRELQEAVLKAFQKSGEVTLDLKEVPYISSAGLRVLLIGEKTAVNKKGKMRLVNIQPSVLEVVHMTGFDKILSIG